MSEPESPRQAKFRIPISQIYWELKKYSIDGKRFGKRPSMGLEAYNSVELGGRSGGPNFPSKDCVLMLYAVLEGKKEKT